MTLPEIPEACSDPVEGLIPSYGIEPISLRPPAKRSEDPVWSTDPFNVAETFETDFSVGRRVEWITLDGDYLPIPDCHKHPAGAVTVAGTDRAYDPLIIHMTHYMEEEEGLEVVPHRTSSYSSGVSTL